MTMDEDRVLRARFHALAAEDARSVPAFAAPAATPRRGPIPVWAGAAAALGLAAGAYAWWGPAEAVVPFPVDLAAVRWIGPTEFLLETPGAALLREVPTIDARVNATPADVVFDDTIRRRL
jgi:hypothetical protein